MVSSLFKIKQLRRRSRASIRTDQSTDTSSEGSQSLGASTAPTSGSVTPPSHVSDPALNLQVKSQAQSADVSPVQARPPLRAMASEANGSSQRHSVSGMTGLGSPVFCGRGPSLPVSQYSPRITNLVDNSWVYQKVLLVHGTIGDPSHQSIDGTLTVSRLDDNFPQTTWPVCESHVKALLYMNPGPNRFRFEFSSPKLANSGSSNPIHSSYLTIHMLPPMNAPPLQLAVLVGKDSPCTFDAVPARVEKEGNGLDTAVRKFRMAAYLWQAFTAEQMWQNKLGRRVFRFEEEWTTGTANYRDRENATMRSEARVHIIRSDKTVAELRNLDLAQQAPAATDKTALFGIAAEAVKKHLNPLRGQKLFVSVLLLDSHWDRKTKTITGHAALGGAAEDMHLAIFGSHCLQSYPMTFEEVVPAFSDCTPTDTNFVANDCNDAGSSWEAANLGIGAHLHETGHLFGCPHQANGVMLRDYVTLNRSFLSREAYSTRTKSRGGPVYNPKSECKGECRWHRLDCLRFRSHPCFRLPNDAVLNSDSSIQAWPVENNNIMIMAASGISFIELYHEKDEVCSTWIEYTESGSSIQRHVLLNEQELRNRFPENKQKGVIMLSIKSHGGGSLDIDNFKKLSSSKEATLKLHSAMPGKGKTAFRGKLLGQSQMKGSEPREVIFASTLKQERVLSKIIFYHGAAVDGLEFVYDDDSTQLFGKRGGKPGGDTFDMDLRRGDYITGFYVRAGSWIDGIQVLTSLGRRSPMYGNAHGGSAHTLIPPRGYTVVGVTGTCGAWVDGFSVVIAR